LARRLIRPPRRALAKRPDLATVCVAVSFLGKLLRLDFLPTHADLALLVFRVWLGASMLALHGWPKLLRLLDGNTSFRDPLGVGPVASLALAVFAEALCSIFLMVGWTTRLSALAGICAMSLAFFSAHGAKLSGEGNGELAFIYLAGYVALFLTGAGRFSLDGGASKGGSKLKAKKA
jgi:putative oxidoreductase